MSQENLFDLIRNEDVILWAGAGLSLYAGYPSGKDLCKILIENLSATEKSFIDVNLTLPDLAEEIYRLKDGKNYLIKTLKDVFEKQPNDTTTHELICKIPHFKTIITTNYDRLFEISYKDKANLILNDINIPYINKDKTQIFKIHGDLSYPDSIILTKTDYNNFFKENFENNTLWTVIKERLSTNSILFLGYNLEDPNTSVIFDRITDNLNTNRKECFLVAPNLPEHKVRDLTRKRISYINSTGEKLFDELIKILKDNVIEDLENSKISADTLKNFLKNFQISPSLTATKDSYRVTSLRGIDRQQVEGKFNATIVNGKDVIPQLKNLIQGTEFGEVVLDENVLKNVVLHFGEIKLSQRDKIVKMIVKPTPTMDSIVNIRFESGFSFEDLPFKVYGGKDVIEIHSNLKSAQLKFRISFTQDNTASINFSYKHNKACSSITNELQLFNFLKNLSSGEEFTIFMADGNKFTHKIDELSDFLEEAQFYLKYFQNLKIIEQKFKIQFNSFEFNEITDDTNNLITNIAEFIQNGYFVREFVDELNFELIEDFSNHTLEQLKLIGHSNTPLLLDYNVQDIQNIHGQTINLGYKKIEYIDPYVTNIPDLEARATHIAKIRSKNYRLSYTENNQKD